MCRLGLAAEVAAAISFLASPRASFLTGVALPVDGACHGYESPIPEARAPRPWRRGQRRLAPDATAI
jgi:hypothetical protein